VSLDRQDRSRWDRTQIDAGLAALWRAMRSDPCGPYQIQAAIAALHDQAPAFEDTDWGQIAELYAGLAVVAPSPVVDLNRAVAISFACGVDSGREALAPLLEEGSLDSYQPLHAAHAELLRRDGDFDRARVAYQQAISLTDNAVERTQLERRLAEISALR
jgi:RNA polymerase sigma-70 factor (ECF subfamily)